MRTKLDITEKYRIDTEDGVEAFIAEAKQEAAKGGYEISAYKSLKKEKKAKGQIIDEGYEVTVVKHYNNFWMDGAF